MSEPDRQQQGDRDHYIDLLRALALSIVVYGHWLVIVVVVGDERLEMANLLTLVPQVQYLTWICQVMPLFFLVGGFANATSWRAAQRRGQSAGDWRSERVRRLAVPAVVLVGVWLVVAAVLFAVGFDPALLRLGLWLAVAPLWFVPVYAAIVALVPLSLLLHDRAGWRVVALLVGLVVATDVAAWWVPGLAWANLAWLWLAVHQFGYLWQDGTVGRRRRAAWVLAGAGLLLLVLLVGPGPYPINMVGIDETGRSNSTPPTLALLALAAVQAGGAVGFRDVGERWLRRPRVRAAVEFGTRMGMTVYVWHLTAVAVLAGVLVLPDLWPAPPTASLAWWALRPLWLGGLTATTAALCVLSDPRRFGNRPD